MSAAIPAGGVRVGRDEATWWRDPCAIGVGLAAALALALLPWSPTGAGVVALFGLTTALAWCRDRRSSVVVSQEHITRHGPLGSCTVPAAEVRRITVVDDEVRPGELVVVGRRGRGVSVRLLPPPGPSELVVLRSFVRAAAAAGAAVDDEVVVALRAAVRRS